MLSAWLPWAASDASLARASGWTSTGSGDQFVGDAHVLWGVLLDGAILALLPVARPGRLDPGGRSISANSGVPERGMAV